MRSFMKEHAGMKPLELEDTTVDVSLNNRSMSKSSKIWRWTTRQLSANVQNWQEYEVLKNLFLIEKQWSPSSVVWTERTKYSVVSVWANVACIEYVLRCDYYLVFILTGTGCTREKRNYACTGYAVARCEVADRCRASRQVAWSALMTRTFSTYTTPQ